MPAITVEAEFTNSLTPPGLNLAKPWPFWADLAARECQKKLLWFNALACPGGATHCSLSGKPVRTLSP